MLRIMVFVSNTPVCIHTTIYYCPYVCFRYPVFHLLQVQHAGNSVAGKRRAASQWIFSLNGIPPSPPARQGKGTKGREWSITPLPTTKEEFSSRVYVHTEYVQQMNTHNWTIRNMVNYNIARLSSGHRKTSPGASYSCSCTNTTIPHE